MNPFATGINERAQFAAGYRGPAEGPISCTTLRTDVPIREIKASYKGFTLILYEDNTLYAVGGGVNGQLGVGSHRDHYLPVKIDLPPVAEISIDGAHCAARLVDGRVATWGGNSWGTKGDGTSGMGQEKAGSPTPWILPGIHDAVKVVTGGGNVAVIHADGTVSMWGCDEHGQLGDGRTLPITTLEGTRPQKVPGLSGVVDIALGGAPPAGHVLALLSDGSVMQWGSKGPCGVEHDLLRPTGVELGAKIIGVEAGPGQSFAIDELRNLLAWGSNNLEQLWLPESVTHVDVAHAAVVLTNVSVVAAGFQYSYAVVNGDGGSVLEGTGRNDTHQLGLAGITGVTQVDAGVGHAVCLADHAPILPPIAATPTTGGADVTWTYHGTPSKPWEVQQRPAAIGAVWSKVTKLDPGRREVQITAPAGQPTEIRVRNGTVFPQHLAEVVPA